MNTQGWHVNFKWNAGTWFGPHAGAVAWFTGGGIALLLHHQPTGIFILVLAIIQLASGVGMWTLRSKVHLHTALQVFLAIQGLCLFSAFVAIDMSGVCASLSSTAHCLLRVLYLVPFCYPFIMRFMYQLYRKAAEQSHGETISDSAPSAESETSHA